MRLILAAAALTALAIPTQAQRLDTRVREVKTVYLSVECRLNANPEVEIAVSTGKLPSMATLIQKPVESERWIAPKLGFIFEPGKGGRFGIRTRFFSFSILDMRVVPAPPPIKVRVLLDGEDSGIPLIIHAEADRPNSVFVEVPEKAGIRAGDRILNTRWIDVELTSRDKTVRTYRFDGLRIADSAEILSIIKFSCDGARAD